ncbi:MAG: hypothetical protein JSV66_11285 [Trueperaceae bacterium]|nr:MAG: hypothetical protein JSV66_11285 [Trueperaceae bacterium]
MFLRTLGGLELEGMEFRRPKSLLLLAYLALEGPQERGHLAELFFADSSKGRSSLSTTLSRLRREAPGTVEADEVRVWSGVETDVGALYAAIDKGEFEAAVKLYKGRFLPGFGSQDLGAELEEWLYAKREAVAARVRQALIRLAEQMAVPGQFEEAASYAERAYLVTGAPEPEHEELTRLYTLLVAADHPQAKEVKREAEAHGVTLTLAPEDAQEQLLESRPGDFLPANPYKGLAFFQEQDAELFFGRDAAIEALVARVQRQSLVAIIGSSGSGKSSLLFAGLLPALRVETDWLISPFRPGSRPFLALAGAIVEVLEPQSDTVDRLHEAKKLASLMRAGELSLSDLLTRLRQAHPEKRFLLVIDQFEQLYTFAQDGLDEMVAYRRALLGQLLVALEQQSHFFKLVLTLRADFMAEALEYRPMVDLLRQSAYLLGPMNESELRAVIEEPARKRRVALEDGLTERILQDVVGREGSLPLLEFALSELWNHQQRDRLTHQAYDAIGGVEQAVANHAEATYLKLSEAERVAAQTVFLQLIHPGSGQEDTRRIATYQEVGEHWPLIGDLASASTRLVVIGQSESGERTAEIVHEALIRHWGRLQRWIDEYRGFRIWQEHLRQDIRRWQAKRDEGYLLRGFPLEEARQQLEVRRHLLGQDELDFIQTSLAAAEEERAEQEQRRRERSRLRRRVTQILSYALAVAVVLTGLAAWQWRLAEERGRQLTEREGQLERALEETELRRDQLTEALAETEKQRLLATFRGLEGQALAALQSGEYSLASLLTAQGLRLAGEDTSARQNFLTVLLNIPPSLRASFSGYAHGLAVSPGGGLIASGGAAVGLWDVDTLSFVGELQIEGMDLFNPALSSDGRILASGSSDDTVILWDVERRQMIGEPLVGHSDYVYSLTFDPGGKILSSTSDDGTIILWDVDTQEQIGKPLVSDTGAWRVNATAFSPDGRILAGAEIYGDIVLWDVDTQEQLGILRGHSNSVASIAFSPDGTLLASSSWDETVILWDVSERAMIGEPLTDHADAVLSVSFSPGGTTLASGSYDKSIILWDVEKRIPLAEPLRGHAGELRVVAFGPDDKTLVSTARDGMVKVWDLASDQRLGEPLESHYVEGMAMAPDGRTFATSSWNGTLIFWDAVARKQLEEILANPQGYVNTLAFSPDGETLVSNQAFEDASLLWDVARREPVGRLEQDSPWNLAYSPDGKLLAAGSTHGDIVLWDMEAGQPAGEPLLGHSEDIESVVFSPDGTLLASSSDDGTVRLWDVETLTPLGEPLLGHELFVNSVAFSPDGKTLASASSDHTVRLWDVETLTPLGEPLTGHEKEIRSVLFHPNGEWLVSAGDDGRIIFWDLERREPLTQPYRETGEITSLSFSPDGSFLLSGGETVSFWNATPAPEDWLARACRLAGRNFTREEWQTYLGDLPYEVTCPQFSSEGR